MPHRWYNVLADMPGQEMSEERYIEIPEEVQDLNRIYRATPLHRAYNLERMLDTPAKIYYKNESVSPHDYWPGSGKTYGNGRRLS